MLRTIKTEVFYDSADLGMASAYANDRHELSISLTWIKLELPMFFTDIDSVFRQSGGSIDYSSSRLTTDVLSDFVASTFMERDERFRFGANLTQSSEIDSAISSLVNNVINMTFVIENSPPRQMRVKTLTSRANHVVVGTFLGYGLAGGNYSLMLITVPAGIVLVGSAVGVARGLENGLSKAIQKMLDRRFK